MFPSFLSSSGTEPVVTARDLLPLLGVPPLSSIRSIAWASCLPLGHRSFLPNSVVDPNTLNLDPDPGFWPNLDPDPGFWPNLDPDPGLYYQYWKYDYMCGSGSVFRIRIWIQKAPEYGSNTDRDPDPQNCYQTSIIMSRSLIILMQIRIHVTEIWTR